jgi:hypothetical protein
MAEAESWARDEEGRYVVSWTDTLNYHQFWVLDMVKGEFVAHVDRPQREGTYITLSDVKWRPSEVSVKFFYEGERAVEDSFIMRWRTTRRP